MRHLFTMAHAETSCLIVSGKMPDGCEDTSEPEDSCVNISITRHPSLKTSEGHIQYTAFIKASQTANLEPIVNIQFVTYFVRLLMISN